MKIIVRCCGERTERRCIQLAEKQGTVYAVKGSPFGETLRKSYKLAMKFNQKWVPMIDGDVLLFDDCLRKAIAELNALPESIFCLDGKTKDKIMIKKRRAGIHIYRTELLKLALPYINNNNIKPETYVRKKMITKGYPTHQSKIVFGLHDYEQYYTDLWRKTVCQTQKLKSMIGNRPEKWKKLAKTDLDYYIIYYAHLYGRKLKPKIIVDSRVNYSAKKMLEKLGINEKRGFKA